MHTAFTHSNQSEIIILQQLVKGDGILLINGIIFWLNELWHGIALCVSLCFIAGYIDARVCVCAVWWLSGVRRAENVWHTAGISKILKFGRFLALPAWQCQCTRGMWGTAVSRIILLVCTAGPAINMEQGGRACPPRHRQGEPVTQSAWHYLFNIHKVGSMY